MVLPPFPALLDAATLLGHNYLPLDADGTARRMPPFVREGNRYVPSLGIGAALLAGGFRPEEVVLEAKPSCSAIGACPWWPRASTTWTIRRSSTIS
jgi:hypothetical protein